MSFIDISHLQSAAGVESLLRVGLTQFDLRIWLPPQFDIFLHFSVGMKNKSKCFHGFIKEKLKLLSLRPPTSLDEAPSPPRWFPLWRSFRRTRRRMPASKASTYLTEVSLFRHLGGRGRLYKHVSPSGGMKSYTPWRASLRAECSHSSPLEAALWGPPCFQ